MAEIEKIQGEGILRILHDLQQDKTFLKMRLLDNDFERLTLVTDIRKWKKNTYFSIDDSSEFHDILAEDDIWRIEFEFTGRDKIKYVFRTTEGAIKNGKIWVAFPEFIERYQRRRVFRLEAPPKTRLFFKYESTAYELIVVNVSLSGTLGVQANMRKKLDLNLQPQKAQALQDVVLVFPSSDNSLNVKIKQCQVKRLKKNPQTQRYEYALEFTEIDEDNEIRLTEAIYRFQREFLRRRKRLKNSQ
ncbi:MAG: PilZ domain-containing protein [Candidatus Hodarchaeota archaeon]